MATVVVKFLVEEALWASLWDTFYNLKFLDKLTSKIESAQ